jgi:hypothetical protein
MPAPIPAARRFRPRAASVAATAPGAAVLMPAPRAAACFGADAAGRTLFYIRGGKQMEQAKQLFPPWTVFLAENDELTKR